MEGQPNDCLYIQHLPKELDGPAIHQLFSGYGHVQNAKSLGGGVALVRFINTEEAGKIKDLLHGNMPLGCPDPLTITFATTKENWTCPNCGDIQFNKNVVCRLCGCPHPGNSAETTTAPPPVAAPVAMFGKAAAAKSNFSLTAPYSGGAGRSKGPSVHKLIEYLITEGLPGSQSPPGDNTLYVQGLPSDTTAHDLYVLFSPFGSISPRGCAVMPSKSGVGMCCGYGFVNYIDSASGEMAMSALNGRQFGDGLVLQVRRKQSRSLMPPSQQAFGQPELEYQGFTQMAPVY
eukprot:TRINITY_DN7738_c0_g1_i2.p1 TRINITY_DN7738_c0_g1~~TRINITY_DN7738_c0_g1_i2.p1  ORF type:complete len:289 (+),score=42.56 TRINITY_DN7738_c0_g1_i2:74-940(+)